MLSPPLFKDLSWLARSCHADTYLIAEHQERVKEIVGTLVPPVVIDRAVASAIVAMRESPDIKRVLGRIASWRD